MTRYLTKSRFKLGLECSAKLYYTKKTDYVDNKIDDPFLAALAEGGFQVGELAKIYFEGGHDIESLDYDIALEQTNNLLRQENVIIYEAAFKFENLFIRADVVRKTGKRLELVEVKAKSYDGQDGFTNKRNPGIKAVWQPYLFDIAFQYYVVKNAMPDHIIEPSLLLADKKALATVDGLNQLFRIQKNGNRARAIVQPGVNKATVGNPILVNVAVGNIVAEILQDKHSDIPFKQIVNDFSTNYEQDIFMQHSLGKHCATCEFKASEEQLSQGRKSGFHECWAKLASFNKADFNKPSILNIWNFKGKDELIAKGIYFQSQMSSTDFDPKSQPSKNAKPTVGMTQAARKSMQVEKSKTGDSSFYLDSSGLKSAMNSCVYPLHFIDFETTAVAVPFNKGRSPYEQTAFQFSHHVLAQDKSISHVGHWINTEAGKFPNFDFIRALKKQLENDRGSIFRYANHENAILNTIYTQLLQSAEKDKSELCTFIQDISHSNSDSTTKWQGPRDMIDLRAWVLQFFYSPRTNGSNSIKDILPAILNDSTYLKDKYSKPIYGTDLYKSLNFTNHTWISLDSKGIVINPYHTLPSIHDGIDNDTIDSMISDEDGEIADGGAAMTAYAKMQFTQMSSNERMRITNALLRYCELDTLAMVMIWEAWYDWCK